MLINLCLSQEGLWGFAFSDVHQMFVSHLWDLMSTKYPKGLPVSKVKIYGTGPVAIHVRSHESGIYFTEKSFNKPFHICS